MPLNPYNSILELNRLVSSKDSEIRLHANGGNSILMVCKPIEEQDFLNELNKLDTSKFELVDLNEVLVEFVEKNKEDIEFYFKEWKASLDQIFKNDYEHNPDLFRLILDKIRIAYNQNRIPIIISTGVIYATHFDMLALMESKVIMEGVLPTVFLYPAENNQNNQLQYLNTRIASQYRCKII